MSPKNLVIGSMVVAGIVAVLSLVDLIAKIPFGRLLLMDILFILSAGLVLYLGYETLEEMG